MPDSAADSHPTSVTEFVKDRPADPRSYPAEAAGLRWLADAGPGSCPIVTVVAVAARRLVLRRLVRARPTRAAAEAFGRALARTHAAGAQAYGIGPPGWSGDGFIGRQPLTLRPTARWGEFYADQRLLPYARQAAAQGTLPPAGLARIEDLAERVRAGEFDDDRPPARIHGDLWSGNVVFTADGVVLIDPAAHGGHPLTDLAMLALFGAPQLDTVLDAYAEAARLPAGWRDLIGLHQLHPLLVHAVSHGPAYGDEAAAIARRY